MAPHRVEYLNPFCLLITVVFNAAIIVVFNTAVIVVINAGVIVVFNWRGWEGVLNQSCFSRIGVKKQKICWEN